LAPVFLKCPWRAHRVDSNQKAGRVSGASPNHVTDRVRSPVQAVTAGGARVRVTPPHVGW
jgi:hypothetical protein